MLQQLHHTHHKEATLLFTAVVQHMQATGLDQWDSIYPAATHITEDISLGHAYGYFVNNLLAGYVALNEIYSDEYNNIPWKTQAPFLVVHRLAFAPKFQGQGLGKKCMLAIETLAKTKDYKAIRFDTFIPNISANNLYINLGYQNKGTVTFRKGQFYCYEKILV
ncbi:N-acetyltransferase [Neptunitalea chrysea]|uniref:N-acetyltransferase n=1 Tax=Neptunitalea chrysea TaxID=1647581 RepID=A0A9W6EW73_9FLAO|nr:GNAT family N-acetyltransferase [Neptunitalea chrysea]GLB52523.1 N-acetyltransferase [Neptunitalea chrysea]